MNNKRVLIADDDEDDREIFERVIGRKTNINLVRSVENGKAVIEFLESAQSPEELPHLIILDHNMPQLNGAETLGIIKSTEKYASIQVVIYSTYSDHNLTARCHALGASLVLAKPSSMKEYEALIDRFLAIVQ